MSDDTPRPTRSDRVPLPSLSDFQHIREDRLRLTDLDFQQHVNNAAQTSLLASARYDFLGLRVRPALPQGDKLVIASLDVRFVREMPYGDVVLTGTRILSIGRTSMKLEQAIFQEAQCVVRAVSVFVHLSALDKSASPWPESVRFLPQAQIQNQGINHD